MAEMEMIPMQTMSPAGKAISPPEIAGVHHVPHKKTRKSLWHYAGRSVQIVFGNMATSARFLFGKLTRSSNPKLRAFKIATIIITFPILALPLLIMTGAKTLIDQDRFPRQARFSYDNQEDTNPPKELSDYRLDLSFGKGGTLTGYEIPPAPDVKPKGTVVYFHDKHSTAASIFQHEHNRIQCMVAEGYRVICATYPGYGGSSGMILSTEDVRRAGQVFIDYARTLVTDDAPELVLWGWSTGANVAAQLANDNSKAVTKVVLQSPDGSLDDSFLCELPYGLPGCATGNISRIMNDNYKPLLGYNFNTRLDLLNFCLAGDDKETVLLHYAEDSVNPVWYSKRIFTFLAYPGPGWMHKQKESKVRLYTIRGEGVKCPDNDDYSFDDFREGMRLHQLMPKKMVSEALHPFVPLPAQSDERLWRGPRYKNDGWWIPHRGDTTLLG